MITAKCCRCTYVLLYCSSFDAPIRQKQPVWCTCRAVVPASGTHSVQRTQIHRYDKYQEPRVLTKPGETRKTTRAPTVPPASYYFYVKRLPCRPGGGGGQMRRSDALPIATSSSEVTVAMAPGKRKAPSSPPALTAPGSPRFLPCPVCGKSFVARTTVQAHAWSCTGGGTPPANNKDTAGGDARSDDGKFVNCPVCSRSFPQHAIESHAWVCVPSTRHQQHQQQQQRFTNSGLEGAAASTDPRSPAGAGMGAKPARKDRSPGPLTDTRKASSSLLSRGSKVNLFPTATSGRSSQDVSQSQKLGVPCQQGDAVQASSLPIQVSLKGFADFRPSVTAVCAVYTKQRHAHHKI